MIPAITWNWINSIGSTLYIYILCVCVCVTIGSPSLISFFDSNGGAVKLLTLHSVFASCRLLFHRVPLKCRFSPNSHKYCSFSIQSLCYPSGKIDDIGPPMDASEALITPEIDSNGQCSNGWVCEHRWPVIQNMIKFRNTVRNAPVTSWWDNLNNQIAFCRGTRGFIAFNNENYDMDAELFTCLPSGIYCDIISGDVVDNKCTGTQVTVDDNGEARIQVAKNVGVLAIHIGVKIRTNTICSCAAQ